MSTDAVKDILADEVANEEVRRRARTRIPSVSRLGDGGSASADSVCTAYGPPTERTHYPNLGI